MEKDICTIVPENTESRWEISDYNDKNKIYCPRKTPYICGKNTNFGKQTLKNKKILCVKNANDCQLKDKYLEYIEKGKPYYVSINKQGIPECKSCPEKHFFYCNEKIIM